MNPWLIVGFLVALIAVGVGGYLKGQSAGKASVEAVWQAREAKINADTANKIAAADKRVADAEHAHAVQISAVDTTYQQSLKDKDAKLQIALNSIKSGGLFVRAACPATGGDKLSGSAPSASLGDGSATARLSDETAQYLVSEASRADAIVAQLTACQQIVTDDRK